MFAYENGWNSYTQKDITGKWHGSITLLVRKALCEREEEDGEESKETIAVEEWIVIF